MIQHFIRQRLFALLTFIPFIFIQCSEGDENPYPFTLQFFTEQYMPFNYTDGDTLTGLAPEVLKEICLQLGLPFKVEVLPWNEAYENTLQTDNAVLFSTVLNSKRKDLFKWAGPLASLDWSFYSSAEKLFSIASLDDAKNTGKIGVISEYAITQYLENQGFTNLVYFSDNKTALDKLLKGEIDLFPSDRLTAEAALGEMGFSYYAIHPRFRLMTDLVYFAFNKQIPDEVVHDFQREIDRLKENGKLKSLYQKYLGSSDVPGTLLIYTEEYPPLTFLDSYGEVSGFGVDLVREIMKRNQLYEGITLTQWRIGYELARHNPNFCLFTMDRTEIRESLFQWVGPLGTNSTFLYAKAGSGISISSPEEAKNLRAIGTVSSWFSDQHLRNLGFTNLVSDGDPLVMTEKLMQGEVDVFVCSSLTFSDILTKLGYRISQVTPAYELMSSDFYIAFSLGTSPGMVNQWQQTFDNLKTDGTYQSVYSKWFPGE